MENIIFEVCTKGLLAISLIGGFAWWMNAGFPMFTVTRR